MSTRNSIKKQRPFVLVKVSDEGYIFVRLFKTPKCLWHRDWLYMIAMSREYLHKMNIPREEWHKYQAIPVNNFNCTLPFEDGFVHHIHIADCSFNEDGSIDLSEDDKYVESLNNDIHCKNKPVIKY